MKGDFYFEKRRSFMREEPEGKEEKTVSRHVCVNALDDGSYTIQAGPIEFSAKDFKELVEKLTRWDGDRKKSKD